MKEHIQLAVYVSVELEIIGEQQWTPWRLFWSPGDYNLCQMQGGWIKVSRHKHSVQKDTANKRSAHKHLKHWDCELLPLSNPRLSAQVLSTLEVIPCQGCPKIKDKNTIYFVLILTCRVGKKRRWNYFAGIQLKIHFTFKENALEIKMKSIIAIHLQQEVSVI